MKLRLPRWTAPLLLLVTGGLFAWYWRHHPEVGSTLSHANPGGLAVIGVLFLASIGCIAWAYWILLKICGLHIQSAENMALTSYSTIANFFGPGQSGPGVRAVYLKQKHGLKLRTYTFATLLYYAVYAVLSGLLLLASSGQYWPLAILGFFGVIGVVWLVLRAAQKKWPQARLHVTPRLLTMLTLAVAAQMACYVLIYFVELQMVQAGASLRQVVAYAGAANFSLFVSLTPGGIGIREAFLAFSTKLHGIGLTSIVAANVIDRAVYVVVLGLLFAVLSGLHVKRRFTL